jgi:chemotaxis response regulator CheB
MPSATPADGQQPDPGAESPPTPPAFKVVGLAASAGGVEAVSDILAGLPEDFPAAIVVVQHRKDGRPGHCPGCGDGCGSVDASFRRRNRGS